MEFDVCKCICIWLIDYYAIWFSFQLWCINSPKIHLCNTTSMILHFYFVPRHHPEMCVPINRCCLLVGLYIKKLTAEDLHHRKARPSILMIIHSDQWILWLYVLINGIKHTTFITIYLYFMQHKHPKGYILRSRRCFVDADQVTKT